MHRIKSLISQSKRLKEDNLRLMGTIKVLDDQIEFISNQVDRLKEISSDLEKVEKRGKRICVLKE